MMRTTGYRNLNVGIPYTPSNDSLRYLSGKDQNLIREDDPGFFSFPADRRDTLSPLSSARRILRKSPASRS